MAQRDTVRSYTSSFQATSRKGNDQEEGRAMKYITIREHVSQVDDLILVKQTNITIHETQREG